MYVPWISKGKRRTESMWNRNGTPPSCPSLFFWQFNPILVRKMALTDLVHSDVIIHEVTPPAATTLPEISSRRVYQNKRVSPTNVKTRRTSIDKLMYSSNDYKKLRIRTKSLSLKSDLENWYEWPSTPVRRTTSPDSMWPCSGYCIPTSPKEANVVSD